MLWLAACLTCLLAAPGVLAQDAGAPLASAPPPTLIMTGTMTLGDRTPAVEGWFSVSVTLENVTDDPVEGELVLKTEATYANREFKVRAPISVAAKSRVSIELPTHGFNSGSPEMTLTAFAESGVILAQLEIGSPLPLNPLLIDLDQPSRIAPGIRGKGMYAEDKAWGASSGDPLVAVGTPAISKGELQLPTRAAGYASATLVLARSETLAKLSGARLTAISDWVLGGGALAVVVTRPEDMRVGPLPRLVGGELSKGEAPRELQLTTRFKLPSGSSYSYGSRAGLLEKPATPSPTTVRELAVYSGGNLRASPWGSAASYGLGEVHVLAFDATRSPEVDDEWVQLKVQDLMRHAWNRRDTQVFPHAMRSLDERRGDSIRRQLDPNEGTRWTVVISALLLLAYSVVAGPVNFFRSAKAGKPLRAFTRLPLYALGTSVLIILLGVAAKGVSGRARHLSLIEAGAGMTRAPITRFRGFYDSSTRSLSVNGSSREAVLDLAGYDASQAERELVVERDGVRIDGIEGKPWQTIVVREDDLTDIGGGLSVVPTASGADVTNRLARDLVGVVVKLPGQPARYFPRLADGATLHYADGAALPPRVGTGSSVAGKLSWQSELRSESFPKQMARDTDGAPVAWKALDDSVPSLDWWPDDVPVVLAQLDGGEGKTSDSGLKLESDRVLIRVLGWGGAP
ncbi:MAG: hypothetical protein R3B89_25115 [Polyangiaceae bacterium]